MLFLLYIYHLPLNIGYIWHIIAMHVFATFKFCMIAFIIVIFETFLHIVCAYHNMDELLGNFITFEFCRPIYQYTDVEHYFILRSCLETLVQLDLN